MPPGLLMLCEDPRREMGQMDRMSRFNGLETTGTHTGNHFVQRVS